MNPFGFSPLRNFLVVAFWEAFWGGGGDIFPLLHPRCAPGPGSQESKMIVSGGWTVLWKILSPIQHLRTFHLLWTMLDVGVPLPVHATKDLSNSAGLS